MTPAYRHASGEDAEGCIACQVDELLANVEDFTGCRSAEPDGDEPELCAYCSHTVEPIPLALPMTGECE